MEPFKNMFNKKSLTNISNFIAGVFGSDFDKNRFQREVNKTLTTLELKDRVRLISDNLYKFLPYNYHENINLLIHCLADEEKENGITGFMSWPLLQYVEDYGRDDFDASFEGMYEMTKRFSAEFAIRPYLQQQDKRVYKLLKVWRKDKNKHIRRLVSEGTRPNLPWGMKVDAIHIDLPRNIKLIDKLKDDPEEYVRRSVANHMNDISRLDEKLFIDTMKEWNTGNVSNNRKWVIRHATRSLLKKGHPEALKLHGYNPKAKIQVDGLKLSKKRIKEGDKVDLSLEATNNGRKNEKMILEYVIHYLKSNGTYSKKAFRLKDSMIMGEESISILKTIHFKRVTTRKHYPGVHRISIQVNGTETDAVEFKLSI